MVEKKINPHEPSVDAPQWSFEQQLLQSELLFSSQTTLREVLNRKGPDIPVGLLDTPVSFQARDFGDAVVYIVSFPEENDSAIGGKRLALLLDTAKPDREDGKKQDENGIINDWGIMLDRSRELYPHYDNLHKDHIHPKSVIHKHFEEFGRNHFKQFWEAIHSKKGIRVREALEFDYLRLMSEEKAFGMYGLDFWKSDFNRFLRLIKYTSPSYDAISYLRVRQAFTFPFEAAFSEFVQQETGVDIQDESGLSILRGFNFGQTLTEEAKSQLITRFYDRLGHDGKKRLVYESLSLYHHPSEDKTILVDSNGNPHDMNDDKNLIIDDIEIGWQKISRISNDEVEVSRRGSYIRVGFGIDQKTGFREKRMVEQHVIPYEGDMTPVMVWKKDKKTDSKTGRSKREYFCGKVSDELIGVFPDMFSQRQDTLLGQIVVAGYSDELKGILPIKLPLVKGGWRQDMLGPQMPVFVPLFARAYLNRSPVIAGFEDLGSEKVRI